MKSADLPGVQDGIRTRDCYPWPKLETGNLTMTLLILGVLLFATVHYIPSLAPGVRAAWQSRFGENGYKGLFSLLLLLSFGLMIGGWRSATPSHLYVPPAGLHSLALAMLVLAFLLLAASNLKTRLRRSAVAIWAAAHLLLNGDSRSLVLFGGLGLWALSEIAAINRRDGVWIKEPAPGLGSEALTGLVAALTLAVVIYLHPWLAGVPVH